MAKDHIRDESGDPSHFAMMPHMADDDLDPGEYRLYGHYKRVCGENGACWQSVETTANKCRMSTGQVSTKRRSLEEKGYIKVETNPKTKTKVVTILPLWSINRARYASNIETSDGDVSNIEGHLSNNEADSSPASNNEARPSNNETKNNPLNQKPDKREEKPEEEEPKQHPPQTPPTDAAAAAAGEIFTLYEQNFGALTPMLADIINDAIKVYRHDWIIDAMRETLRNNSRRWSYVNRILERWRVEGRGAQKPNPSPSSASPPPQYFDEDGTPNPGGIYLKHGDKLVRAPGRMNAEEERIWLLSFKNRERLLNGHAG